MADADKTTAEADLTPLPDAFVTPTTLAEKLAGGGWDKKDRPEPGKAAGPGKSQSGDR
jgi:hypothetical protein